MTPSSDEVRWKIGFRQGAALIERHLKGQGTRLFFGSLACARHFDGHAPYNTTKSTSVVMLYNPIWSKHSNGWARGKGDIKAFIKHLNRGGWTNLFGPVERGVIDAILDSVGC